MALTLGDWKEGDQVLTRIQSVKTPQDLLKNLLFGQSASLERVFQKIKNHGSGAVLFINPPDDSNQIIRQLGDLKSKNKNKENISAYMDDKDFGIGAQMLHQLHIHKLSLMTNSERTKRVAIGGYGIEISDWVSF